MPYVWLTRTDLEILKGAAECQYDTCTAGTTETSRGDEVCVRCERVEKLIARISKRVHFRTR
jgi:hypothetical protein